MLGIIIGLCIAAWNYVFKGTHDIGVLFLAATHFMLVWYCLWTGVLFVFFAVITVIAALGGSVAGATNGGVFGGLLGLVGVGGATAAVAVLAMATRLFWIGGAWVLNQSYSNGQWDTGKLIIGGVLILIGVICSRSSSSNSSND